MSFFNLSTKSLLSGLCLVLTSSIDILGTASISLDNDKCQIRSAVSLSEIPSVGLYGSGENKSAEADLSKNKIDD